MSNIGGVVKPRRKPATYGKTSRRALGGIHHGSISTSISDDENDTKDISKYVKPSLQRHTTDRSNVGRHGLSTISNRKPEEKKKMDEEKEFLSSHSAVRSGRRSNNDIFDFPSSEDEQTPLRSIKPKPEMKRRKLQSPASTSLIEMEMDSAVLEPVSSSEPRTIPTTVSRRDAKISSKSHPDISPHLKRSLTKATPRAGSQMHKSIKRSRKLDSPGSSPKRYDDDLARSGFPKKRLQLSPSPQYPTQQLNSTSNHFSKEHTINSMHHNSFPEGTRSPSQESESIGSGLSVVSPRTPPRRIPIGEETSPKRKISELFPHPHLKFLSPGGLDIPNLHITAIEYRAPHRNTGSGRLQRENVERAPIRTKLKDRLVSSKSHFNASTGEVLGPINPDDHRSESSAPSSSSEDCRTSAYLDLQSQSNSHSIGSQSKLSDTVAPVQSRGLKVTYAARNRTVLKDETEDLLLSLPVIDASDTPRSRRVVNVLESPKPKSSQQSSHALDDLDEAQTGSLKSIHELREAGVNARVMREMEAVLDDIDNSTTVSQKRSALIDLAMKLKTQSFSQQITNSGLETRLLQYMVPDPDTISEMLLTIILLEIISGLASSHLVSQLNQPSLLKFVSRNLDVDDELMTLSKERKSNMSKSLQGEVRKICISLKDSTVWREGRPKRLTGRIISLQCLEYLVRRIRESGSMQEILSQEAVEKLISILKPLPSISDPASNTMFEVQLALSTLESSTIITTLPKEVPEYLWTSSSIYKLANFLVSICGWTSTSMAQIWCLTLRLCINLTNGNASTCDIFSIYEVIEGVVGMVQSGFQQLSIELSEDVQGLTVDSLILSLGFLIHLAENKEKTRKLFLLRSEGSTDPLNVLLDLFAARLQSAFEVSARDPKSGM